MVQAALSDADYLTSVLASVQQTADAAWPEDPARQAQTREELLAVTVDELYQETLRSVLDGTAEIFVLDTPPDAQVQWRPMLSRDAETGQEDQGTSAAAEGQPGNRYSAGTAHPNSNKAAPVSTSDDGYFE